jgi:predicted transglutaminase-like cysteine proteinase
VLRSTPLSPVRLLKYILLPVACLGLGATSCFAHPSFLTVASTPYDRQMTPISRVLNSSVGTLAGRTSLARMDHWLTNLRAIPYHYSSQWKTPAQVTSNPAADCKGKAIVLYAIMRANGARHIRFVIGKHHIADQRTHAWLEWDTTNGTYLLDPTFNKAVERVGDYNPARYIPHYAYDGARKYRATYYRPSHASIVASN